MVTKSKSKASKKQSTKGRVKALSLKRESVKDLSRGEQKKVKGGGGVSGSVMGGRNPADR